MSHVTDPQKWCIKEAEGNNAIYKNYKKIFLKNRKKRPKKYKKSQKAIKSYKKVPKNTKN